MKNTEHYTEFIVSEQHLGMDVISLMDYTACFV